MRSDQAVSPTTHLAPGVLEASLERRPKSAVVVVDVETTGFGKRDKVVEIAMVAMDAESWEVLDEYDTLLNPERDVGATGVHGIDASMVELAPAFGEVVGDVARRLNGAVLVAHNLPFDRRMLGYEFDRHGVRIDMGSGLCTLKATRKKLQKACEERDIPLSRAHRALADARATAELAKRIFREGVPLGSEPVRVGHVAQPPSQRTVRRGLVDSGTSPMQRVVSRSHYPRGDELICAYLDALDWVLDDGVVDKTERAEMERLARDWGISERDRMKAHRAYFDCIAAAAMRDGVVSPAEHEIMVRIAGQLELADVDIPAPDPVAGMKDIAQGDRICFTGKALVDGRTWDRDDLQAVARRVGLAPVANVSKKGCDVLVAADVASASVKARAARRWGKPVVSVADFLAWAAAR